MPGVGEVQYLVLPDAENPYLLARVRWPDVFQAISAAARPEWLEDQGLFDLPYDPSSARVTVERAAAIASEWGARLPSGADEADASHVASLIRRMPADWSNLSPAEKRAWSLEFVRNGRPTTPSFAPRRLMRSLESRVARWLGFDQPPAPPDIEGAVTPGLPAAGGSALPRHERADALPALARTRDGDGVDGDDGAGPGLADIVSLPDVSHDDAEPLVDEPAS